MTNTKPENYQVGDIIEYRPFGGGLRTVRVTSRDSDIKKGQPGFDGVCMQVPSLDRSDASVWGYDSQISRIVRWAGCPAFDELPVRARVDLTGVLRAEHQLDDGKPYADVLVTGFHEAASGRRYAQYVWRDETFMAPLSEVDFEV